MSARPAFRRNLRIALAGPGVIVTAFLVSLALGFGLPKHLDPNFIGRDKPLALMDSMFFLTLSLVALFYEACLDRSLKRVAIIMGTLALLSVGLLVWHFVGATPPGGGLVGGSPG